MFPALIRFNAISALTLLALAVPPPAAAQQPHPGNPRPPQKNVIHAEGCVQAGMEAHCRVLKDTKTGRFYSLLFKADQPPVGMGIEFTGTPHPGPNTCMQGAAVDVTTWAHKTSIKCAPGEAGKRGQAATR